MQFIVGCAMSLSHSCSRQPPNSYWPDEIVSSYFATAIPLTHWWQLTTGVRTVLCVAANSDRGEIQTNHLDTADRLTALPPLDGHTCLVTRYPVFVSL